MAFGDPYITLDQLKGWLKIPLSDTQDDVELTAALAGGTSAIEDYTGRQFNRDTGGSPTATARLYTPRLYWKALVDDFYSTTGLVIETGDGDGVFDFTWTTADYVLAPANGIVNGKPGWPYWRIKLRSAGARSFCTAEESLRVTALWGWSAIPANVTLACRILSSELFKLKDAPFGVAGFGEYGVVRIKENPVLCKLLDPYKRDRLKVAA
jgi:hypothetical protein